MWFYGGPFCPECSGKCPDPLHPGYDSGQQKATSLALRVTPEGHTKVLVTYPTGDEPFWADLCEIEVRL